MRAKKWRLITRRAVQYDKNIGVMMATKAKKKGTTWNRSIFQALLGYSERLVTRYWL